ncbi:MAG: carbamoyltransferase HypF [Geobacteraceae bacterium]|nr:carbamoyltransferase HypF [Geobacteraceae bacterium]
MVPLAWRGGSPIARTSIRITGIVQGVGFRPFVYRLAVEMGLAGWVSNSAEGVLIEASSSDERLAHFIRRIRNEAPPLAVISTIQHHALPDDCYEQEFTIRESSGSGIHSAHIAPDAALCDDCLQDLFNPADRRFRYPFITCTNCGPRYSIITGIPYDRPKTTMASFSLCPDCQKEYYDPTDRRFHAQPIACPSCGPQVRLLDSSGLLVSEKDAAVIRAVELLKAGAILAVKGIGGYHLATNACDTEAVRRLRNRKKRDEKPFAVMASSLSSARTLALLSEMEEKLLASQESPIVIVRRATDCPISPLIAPDNLLLGLMLPYTPLQHLLLHGDNFAALVMTSANLSDEPIAFQDTDALQRLSEIADFFLLHDRPIHMRGDDSVIRVFQGRPLFYRRARGYAPRPIRLPFESTSLLAVGAELKNTVCLVKGSQAFLSQHIGDLQNETSFISFQQTIRHLSGLLEVSAEMVACDRHPDYLSSVHAAESGLPLIPVQHHHAHLAACMAENGLDGEVIGLIFDGTGYGGDGTVWGGEFLVGGYDNFRRVGHFRQVRLPGGDKAVREPWRMALAYLYMTQGNAAFSLKHPVTGFLSAEEKALFSIMLENGLNAPLTSSCGRLFDAVAALLNIRHIVSYDGQAAIELEALAETGYDERSYRYTIISENGQPLQLDFSEMFPDILADMDAGIQTASLARRFHVTVASAVVDVCMRIIRTSGLERVVLSGGVFQNRLLSEMIYTALDSRGVQVFTHRLTPPNDGCIALGQAAIAGWKTRRNN